MNEQQKPENDIIVSFDDVKMKDFRAYWKAVARSDWEGQDAFFAKVVKAWPFEGNPGEAEAYGELSFRQYKQVQSAIKLSSGSKVGV